MSIYKDRQEGLIEAVKELSGDEARDVLRDVFGAIVTDTAGNINAPFAYMWRTDFIAIESRVTGCSEAQTPDA